jgi:LysM repeat protein
MSIRLRCAALMLMLCLWMSGCSPTAETQLDEQRNPHYLAGKEKLGALDYKGAIESFERAVEDNPRSAFAHFELGVLYEQRESDYATALYHYNRALKLRPNGHPAEIIRQRIPGCKQELVKADSLAIINPNALRETENLRAQNAALRSQVEQLQAQLLSRPITPITGSPTPTGRDVPSPSGFSAPPSGSETSIGNRTTPPSTTTGSPSGTSSTRGRTHVVRAGETVTSIAKRYSVKPGSLLAANPGLDPRRMKIGQTLNVPAQ